MGLFEDDYNFDRATRKKLKEAGWSLYDHCDFGASLGFSDYHRLFVIGPRYAVAHGVKTLCERPKFSQRKFAKLTGISRSSIRRLLRSPATMTYVMLARACCGHAALSNLVPAGSK